MNHGFLKTLAEKGWAQNPDGTWSRRPVAGVAPKVAQPIKVRALDGRPSAQGGRTAGLGGRPGRGSIGRWQVDLVAFTRRPLDDDNLIGGMKPLRDAIAATIGVDDGDPAVRFVVHQLPAGSGPEGTTVKITYLP